MSITLNGNVYYASLEILVMNFVIFLNALFSNYQENFTYRLSTQYALIHINLICFSTVAILDFWKILTFSYGLYWNYNHTLYNICTSKKQTAISVLFFLTCVCTHCQLACTKYKESYCSHPGCLRPRPRPCPCPCVSASASAFPSHWDKVLYASFSKHRQPLIRKHSYLDHRYPGWPAFIPWLLTSELMPRGGARGQNLGHL